jgi:hypothetical protein
MMNVNFEDYYTQLTWYYGNVDDYKFKVSVQYHSRDGHWTVKDVIWMNGCPTHEQKATKRINELVYKFFEREESE